MDGRLSLIYDMVPFCRLAADIGTDHGYLICALVESGRAKYGVATDINPLPLDRASREVEGRGLSHKIKLVLGDGLAGIKPDGLEVAVIAGMGGETIAHIMGEWPHSKNPGLLWLLQPMTKAEKLRDWLWGEGYSLIEERCCLAAGRVYSVMAVRYTGESKPHQEWERHLGKVDPGRDEFSLLYAEKKAGKLEMIAQGLRAGGDGAKAEKLEQAARQIRERRKEMTTVADVAKAVDSIAPFGTQMDWDNSGLLVGDPSRGVTKILVALDAATTVIDQAEALGAEVIVTHHPVIFRGIKRLLAGDPPYEAAARGIAVISAHTCYDMAPQGVNTALADALGLRDRAPLWEECPGEEKGRSLGIIGELPCPMSREELAAWVEEALGLRPGFVRYLPASGPDDIRRVAVCGGAGADYLETAIEKGCGAYITGDVRHHEFLAAAEMGLFLMDAGHFATENIAMPRLAAQLQERLPGIEVVTADQ